MRVVAGVLSVLVVLGYAVGSGLWVATGDAWYRALDRPPWQPPDAVFGLIWPYNFLVLMIVGVVLAATATPAVIGWWLGLLSASVVAALAWAYLFYIPHLLWPAAGALALACLLTVPLVVLAWRTHWWAGAILLPYLVWLALATSLSVGYAVRN